VNIEWTAQGLRDIAYWGAVNPKIITKACSGEDARSFKSNEEDPTVRGDRKCGPAQHDM
jgi:hypothetical protein